MFKITFFTVFLVGASCLKEMAPGVLLHLNIEQPGLSFYCLLSSSHAHNCWQLQLQENSEDHLGPCGLGIGLPAEGDDPALAAATAHRGEKDTKRFVVPAQGHLERQRMLQDAAATMDEP